MNGRALKCSTTLILKQQNCFGNVIQLIIVNIESSQIKTLNEIIYHMSLWYSIMVYELNEKMINDSVIKKKENVNHLNETVVIIIRGQMFVTLCMDMNDLSTFWSFETLLRLCCLDQPSGLFSLWFLIHDFFYNYGILLEKFNKNIKNVKKYFNLLKYNKKNSASGYRSAIFEEKFMENLVPNFQNLVIKEKIFMIFQLQNYLQIFAFSTDFIPLTLTFGENFKGAEVKNRSIFTAPNVVDRHKKKKKHTSFFKKNRFLYDCNSKTNHCKYLKFSPHVYINVINTYMAKFVSN
ncbi:hypothetical protein AGLY_015398 [Aphis glycines]|uniref:Uncharacterized protein n=1 Tax=Aphis glycines TaxID=307491 RepID=A0A6G0T198_APHGL|nr:hypothetical protein AGLY_015398 [Aphis glycines]